MEKKNINSPVTAHHIAELDYQCGTPGNRCIQTVPGYS